MLQRGIWGGGYPVEYNGGGYYNNFYNPMTLYQGHLIPHRGYADQLSYTTEKEYATLWPRRYTKEDPFRTTH